MTDTTHEPPERVYMLPSFAVGLEKQPQYGRTAEYILKSHSNDLVQAAIAAERERCARVSESFGCCHVPQEIADAIREGDNDA